MADELPYDRILQECLKSELRVINAHLPSKQKPLSALLSEEYPHVLCRDGSTHLFKRKELKYLAGLLDAEEQGELLLPILIGVVAGVGEIVILCPGVVEEKVISKILDMPVTRGQKGIVIYKPQLAILRKLLRTTTQYLFPPRL
ncbi:MAG: DUF61 family protein [Dehalococcoidia bacterium]|nr:MAG: DUF61 family protein [Dehalococcoidia bacterium]